MSPQFPINIIQSRFIPVVIESSPTFLYLTNRHVHIFSVLTKKSTKIMSKPYKVKMGKNESFHVLFQHERKSIKLSFNTNNLQLGQYLAVFGKVMTFSNCIGIKVKKAVCRPK